MNILFTICGRAGSKGIKNKNIKKFLGIPLPLYTLSAIDLYLEEHKDICGDIVLNTDSKELINIIREIHMRPVDIVKRKEQLAGDHVSKIAVIRDTYETMEERKKQKYDMVVDLDITSPLRCVSDIENLVTKKREYDCDIVFSVTDARRNPYFNMVQKSEKGYQRVIESKFVSRQMSKEVFDMNASLYAYEPQYLKTGNEIFEGHCEIIHMYDTAILDLDHESDFELMQVIAGYLFEKKASFGEIQKHCLAFWK